MAFVAVRHCDMEHAPATRGGQGGDAARRNLAVVRVRSNDQKGWRFAHKFLLCNGSVRCIRFDASDARLVFRHHESEPEGR
jgi:hypothetical protein